MNIKKVIMTVVTLVALCTMMFTLTACSKDVNIIVNDCDTKTEVQTKTGLTVSKVLEDSQIQLNEKDETEPKLDEKITEETEEITIKRYAKVKVVYKDKESEVELIGGKVKDAIKKLNITLEKDETLDVSEDTYLKDGMVIKILSKKTVSITVDGKTSKVLTDAVDVKALLEEQKITLDKDDEISEKLDAEIKDGMEIKIDRAKHKETTEEADDTSAEEDYDSEVYYENENYDNNDNYSNDDNNDSAPEEAGGNEGGKTEVGRTQIYDCDGSGHGYWDVEYSDGSHEYIDF